MHVGLDPNVIPLLRYLFAGARRRRQRCSLRIAVGTPCGEDEIDGSNEVGAIDRLGDPRSRFEAGRKVAPFRVARQGDERHAARLQMHGDRKAEVVVQLEVQDRTVQVGRLRQFAGRCQIPGWSDDGVAVLAQGITDQIRDQKAVVSHQDSTLGACFADVGKAGGGAGCTGPAVRSLPQCPHALPGSRAITFAGRARASALCDVEHRPTPYPTGVGSND